MSLFRPKQTIRVTTKEQFSSALQSADQIVVEGDDQLLSYAIAKASRDPRNKINVELDAQPVLFTARGGSGNPEVDLGAPRVEMSAPVPASGQAIVPEPPPVASATIPQPPREDFSERRPSHTLRLVLTIAALAFAAGVIVFAWFSLSGNFHNSGAAPAPLVPPPRPHIPPLPTPEVPTTSAPPLVNPDRPADETTSILQTLAWPAVSIIAIIVVFLIARQAVAGGQNVEISWKVTEKVSGRVVITRVRERIPRKAKAA